MSQQLHKDLKNKSEKLTVIKVKIFDHTGKILNTNNQLFTMNLINLNLFILLKLI